MLWLSYNTKIKRRSYDNILLCYHCLFYSNNRPAAVDRVARKQLGCPVPMFRLLIPLVVSPEQRWVLYICETSTGTSPNVMVVARSDVTSPRLYVEPSDCAVLGLVLPPCYSNKWVIDSGIFLILSLS